ncbi:hypothetical protein [Streptomyces griseiscabiei]|uniref:Uncharacterized protein n=1 Tax=Streptomyces griseiscabiei TaxID=2993540 RepID=A0ABU4KYG4_9ACTN|nr:hypothetical protein [Streptomyces griseiscabiei]MBZ3904435.1 hypothetical protein [Streptomyces griseiscabiei]MDX2908183.1 hypothetical protein [Streptomyces griseiscabiei]
MHITEFAHALADRLPGWQPSPTRVLTADDPASNRIWDSGPLPYAAFFTDDVHRHHRHPDPHGVASMQAAEVI